MKKWLIITLMSILAGWTLPCLAEEKATPQEVYDLILRAVPVMEELGPEGLAAFKDPKGEFVFKDTYVVVVDCEKMVLAAHPNPKLVGVSLKGFMDKNPDPAKRKDFNQEMCDVGKRPNGGWAEFYWTKLGDETPYRKINFSLRVPGFPYTLNAGIYDDTASVEDLNAQLQ